MQQQQTLLCNYPAEVEDLLLDISDDTTPSSTLSTTCVAGYTVIVNGTQGPALVFQVVSSESPSSDSNVIPLDVPRRRREFEGEENENLLLTSWPAAWKNGQEGQKLSQLGVGICSRQGVLRIYRSVDVQGIAGKGRSEGAFTSPRCEEVRVQDALKRSCGREDGENIRCLGLAVGGSYDSGGKVFIYIIGSAESAAMVSFGREGNVMVEYIKSPTASITQSAKRSRASTGLSSLFYSALRSLGGGDSRKEEEVIHGIGEYSLAGVGAGSDSSCYAVYRNGNILKWNEDKLVWAWNALDSLRFGSYGADWVALNGAVTSNDTIAILAAKQETDSPRSRRLYLLGVQEPDIDDVPEDISVQVDLNLIAHEDSTPVQFIMSGDLAYVACTDDERIVWSSVTPGVGSSEQVRGKVDTKGVKLVHSIDVANALIDSVGTGGAAGFLSEQSILLVRSGVPAPMVSTGARDQPEADLLSKALTLVHRAYLQYQSDQRGAAKATISSLVAEAYCGDVEREERAVEALGEGFISTSRGIIDNAVGDKDTPVALLIDARLEDKAKRHEPLMRLLADQSILVDVVTPRAGQGNGLWDILSDEAQSELVSDAEKLGAAGQLRKLENSQSRSDFKSRFLDDDMSTTASVMTRSQYSMAIENGEEEEVGTSIIVEALELAAAKAGLSSRGQSEMQWHGAVYEKVSCFDEVLPALGRSLRDQFDKLREGRGDGNEEKSDISTPLSTLRRFARQKVLLADEAALAVVNGALSCRESLAKSLNLARFISPVREDTSWCSGRESCRRVLADMIDVTVMVSRSCRRKDAVALQNAAVNVADSLLMCGRYAMLGASEDAQASARSERSMESPRKRRRTVATQPASKWEKERREVLNRLIDNVPDQRCLQLATEYKDYGTMLQLTYDAVDFREGFERWYSEMGEDFGLFACKWLEERGKLKLLLSRTVDDGRRNIESSATGILLDNYFRDHRPRYSNLCWMHYITENKLGDATNALQQQASALAQPGKSGALPNAKLLYSLAKLSLHAMASDAKDGPQEDLREVDHVLFLLRANQELTGSSGELLSRDDLIKRLIEEAPIQTEIFASRAFGALQSLLSTSPDTEDNTEMRDYIWRRIVERESHLWLPLISRAASMSDTMLRGKLQNTAFSHVARAAGLNSDELATLIDRGTFDIVEKNEQRQLKMLHSLLQTTAKATVQET